MLPMVRQAHHEGQALETRNLMCGWLPSCKGFFSVMVLSKDKAKISGFFSTLLEMRPRSG